MATIGFLLVEKVFPFPERKLYRRLLGRVKNYTQEQLQKILHFFNVALLFPRPNPSHCSPSHLSVFFT